MRILLSILAAILITISASGLLADEIGSFFQVDGEVLVFKDGEFSSRAKKGDNLYRSDEIRVGVDSNTKIVLIDDTILSLGPLTSVLMSEYMLNQKSSKCKLNLIKGQMRSIVIKGPSRHITFSIKTPTAVVGVRGTDLVVGFEPQQQKTDVVVISGLVSVKNVQGLVREVIVRSGYATTVHRETPPSSPKKIDVEKFKKELSRSPEKVEEEEIKEAKESVEDIKMAETKALTETVITEVKKVEGGREEETELEEISEIESPVSNIVETNIPPVMLEPLSPRVEVKW